MAYLQPAGGPAKGRGAGPPALASSGTLQQVAYLFIRYVRRTPQPTPTENVPLANNIAVGMCAELVPSRQDFGSQFLHALVQGVELPVNLGIRFEAVRKQFNCEFSLPPELAASVT